MEIPKLGDGGGAPVTSEGAVRFGRVPFQPGMKWNVRVHASSDIGSSTAGDQSSAYDSEYSVEVVETNGRGPTRVRLAFAHNFQTFRGSERTTSIDGNTYEIFDRAPFVRNAAGALPTEDETTRVLDVFPDLGTRTEIDQILPDAPMAIGEERPELAGAILRVLHPRAWKLAKGSAKLSRVENGDAVFGIELSAKGQTTLSLDVHGEARIRVVDARLVKLVLQGTFTSSADETGMFSLERTVTDSR